MHRMLLVGLALGACAEAPELNVARQALYCDEFLCTGNSADVLGKEFGELHEGGWLSPKGFKILQTYTPTWDPGHLQVDGPWPRIVPDDEDDPPISGGGMVGAWISLQTPNPAPNNQVLLHITDYREIPYFDGLPGPRIAGFQIEYLYQNPDTHNTIAAKLCPHETVDEQGISSTWAILSQGDRFSDDASIISTGAAVGGWFNLSCAGAVVAKLLRIRHAFAATDGSHSTKLEQRKAALRMFTAKYCKDGPLYTFTGTPLTWEDYAPWTKPIKSTPEAIWTADGAYCLVEPRYADPERSRTPPRTA